MFRVILEVSSVPLQNVCNKYCLILQGYKTQSQSYCTVVLLYSVLVITKHLKAVMNLLLVIIQHNQMGFGIICSLKPLKNR